MNIFMSVGIGFLAGLLRAAQGSYKDAPWEKFEWIKFNRSLFFSMLGGMFWYFLLTRLGLSVHPSLLFVLCVLFDSITTEMYKRGFRIEDLRKYKMPTILHINGNIIRNRVLRGVIAATIWLGTFGLFFLVRKVNIDLFGDVGGGWLWGGAWGFFAGLLIGIGGAGLDTAWEGFEPLKFFRSPIHGLFWGVVFSHLTNDAGILVFACLGMDRMGLEFYKSFMRKAKSGKFKSDKPTYPKWYEVREKILLPYLIPWLAFIYFLAAVR